MNTNKDQFITTVANCFLRDTDIDAIVMKSKTLVNSNIAFSVGETEIRGGEFHELLYVYNHSRSGEITLEDAQYVPELFAINMGQTIQKKMSDAYIFEEKVVLDNSGNGKVLLKTPLNDAKAYVQTADKSIVTKNFSGDTFSMGAAFANKTVFVAYKYEETLDVLTIDNTFSKTYELVMEVKVWDKYGLKEKIQWIFPAFKPSGNFEMPLASDSPSTSSMNGKVLSENDVYGYKKVIPVSGEAIKYTAVTADVGELALKVNEEYLLTVYALRGTGIYAPITLDNTDCAFISSKTATATVTAGGLIEGKAAGTAYVTITYEGLTDIVEVVVTTAT